MKWLQLHPSFDILAIVFSHIFAEHSSTHSKMPYCFLFDESKDNHNVRIRIPPEHNKAVHRVSIVALL
jgi:hypothetical protein